MASMDAALEAQSSLRRHGFMGYLIAVLLVGGLIYWATVTEIAGAVVAVGAVTIEGGSKRVQHQEGGIVREILVQNEDVVTDGQVLLRLDGTSVHASLAVLEAQLDDAIARHARLLAESQGATTMSEPSITGWRPGPSFGRVFRDQERLMASRAQALSQRKAQSAEQVNQLRQQISGLEAQKGTVHQQLELLEQEWVGLDELLEKGLTNLGRANTNRNQRIDLSGQIARIEAEVASIRASIAEREIARTQVLVDFQSEAMNELAEVNVAVAELLQQRIALEDRLVRLEVRAPQAGVVHESHVQTIGGVVAPGDVLMTIIPESATTLADIRVSPLDIDKVSVGQHVSLRFPTFDARTTPELDARITTVSAATSLDPVTGATFYTVRIALDDNTPNAIGRFVPGMPVEAFIETGNRTVISYLAKPLVDQVMHTFRED